MLVCLSVIGVDDGQRFTDDAIVLPHPETVAGAMHAVDKVVPAVQQGHVSGVEALIAELPYDFFVEVFRLGRED